MLRKPSFNWTRNEIWLIIIKSRFTEKWHEILVAKLLVELMKSHNSFLMVFPVFQQSHSDYHKGDNSQFHTNRQ